MSTALLAAFALASLPAANPLSLPEALSVTPLPASVSAGGRDSATAGPASGGGGFGPSMTPLPASVSAGGRDFATAGPASGAGGFGASSPSPLGLAGGALIILALGAATLWMNKRKRQGSRHIHVVETASLGPKRSLALVVVGNQSLLLSCSESGIFLVSSQPASAELLQSKTPAPAVEPPTPLFGRAAPAAAPSAAGGFAVQLAEAEETQGLRRRLSEAGVLR